jgi:hypothetical protein
MVSVTAILHTLATFAAASLEVGLCLYSGHLGHLSIRLISRGEKEAIRQAHKFEKLQCFHPQHFDETFSSGFYSSFCSLVSLSQSTSLCVVKRWFPTCVGHTPRAI